ncbi:F-box protein (Pof7), putative [Talaromyces stipitatus ATCC 10500]|uniref:F-box protein (Pof7), putative n=1 Tax=Talaromyces stipitatus (strain ATCC 10500 / CBS 375.48 / QM 6759 / NRRL 1006) TaxID=441959 RepID=B8LYX5_TALSN|nr:F-box protein (Pof7), putative [Talaromyces stipitatus ATCC 10500]EED23483.1 F-box protein (Pof7), putative [Talaromyces stipitatus ATCC 10500]
MEESPELNAFRRQWREEVTRRNQTTATPRQRQPTSQNLSSTANSHLDHLPPTKHEAADRKDEVEEEDFGRDYGEFVQRTEALTLRSADEDSFQRVPQKEPRSALEHFEKAVEKEAEGSLGDSLAHYRKAYRLDAAIDQKYRKKHFSAKPAPTQSTPITSTSEPRKSTKEKSEDVETLPTPELILSFANLPIPPAEPYIEGDPAPPCPIAKIPNEILIEVLDHVAFMDPASWGRMSLVCKRFAYHFAHEQQIWKRLCQGHEFGFGSMHYSFNCDVLGDIYHSFSPAYTPFPRGTAVSIPEPLSSWSQVFQSFPRIRFTGIYISTVNYTRPGGASSYANAAWTDPIHIVTYYRYLRFYPDGSVISLLTTTEPIDVVPHISKENVAAARLIRHPNKKRAEAASHEASTSGAPVPTVAMQALKYALRGRWHLTRPTNEEPQNSEIGDRLHSPLSTENNQGIGSDPRDLIIETEGVDPKYTYVLHLGLRSSNPARAVGATKAPPNVSKNTKLVWKGFWSYNKLTDDWGEFGLRNDRSFAFRRVRGWGF